MLRLLLLLVLGVGFLLPLLAGTPLPGSLAPEEIGRFLRDLWAYWVQVFQAVAGGGPR